MPKHAVIVESTITARLPKGAGLVTVEGIDCICVNGRYFMPSVSWGEVFSPNRPDGCVIQEPAEEIPEFLDVEAAHDYEMKVVPVSEFSKDGFSF